MTVIEMVKRSHESHLDKFNEHALMLRDAMVLDARDCEEMLTLIGAGPRGSRIAPLLRKALCEALDVIRCEDVLVTAFFEGSTDGISVRTLP